MKKKILIPVFILGIAALVLTACGAARSPEVKEWERAVMEAEEAMRDLPDFSAVDPTRTPSERDVMDEWDEVMDLADAWGGVAAQYEMREYEDMRSLSLPRALPSMFAYDNSKVSYSRDNSTDRRVSLNVDMRTPDDFEDVENYYIDQLERAGWRFESETARSDSYSVTAVHENERVTVRVSGQMYSPIVDIRITYSKDL